MELTRRSIQSCAELAISPLDERGFPSVESDFSSLPHNNVKNEGAKNRAVAVMNACCG
jgi:hypothetical protein